MNAPAPTPSSQSTSPSFEQWLARTLFNQPSFSAFAEPFVQWVKPNWQASGIRCQVVEKQFELRDVFTLTLKTLGNMPSFKAGQYVDISLNRNGARHTRTFSISSSPEHHQKTGLIQLTIKIQQDGALTQWMADTLESGTFLHISPAKGEFVLNSSDTPLLLIAGGSGITPFRAMLNSLSVQQPQRPVTLLYFAREFIFQDELTALEQNHPQLNCHWINTQQSDHLDLQLIQKVCANVVSTEHYICGPHSLIKSARQLLTELNVPSTQIHFEYFGAQPLDLPTTEQSNSETPVVSFAKANKVVHHQPNKSLLELAESADLKPLHGCRRGVCHQCLCKKNSGVVFNTLTQQYSDTGPADIQLCVSVPVTPVSLDL